jgi:two-component sensor histidine kinase
VQALAQGKPIELHTELILLSFFTWPVTLLMVWLGARVKRVWLIAIAAAAAPALWDFAIEGVRSGWDAAVMFLVRTNRTIDFLVFFAIALGALAYERYLTWRRNAAEVAELDSVLLRTRARLLRLQLNPHFLFNALNSIAALLDDERDAARRMSAQLRNFVDRVLATSDRQEVPLGEELDLLSAYFAIENVRFGDRLQLDLDVARGADGALVPSFFLQPLVENALRHGLQPETGGRVSVTAAVNDDALSVEVLDNGRPRASVVREGIGLSNTRARLRQLYGDAFSFDVERREDGFRARLVIPFRNLHPSFT